MYFHYFVIISPRKKGGAHDFLIYPFTHGSNANDVDQQYIWQNKYVLEN